MKKNINDSTNEIRNIIKFEGVLSKGFGILYKQVMLDIELPIQSKAIYSLLCSFASSENQAFPKIETIKGCLGISNNNTFYKYFNILKEQGYIISKRRYNGSNIYTITSKPSKFLNKLKNKPDDKNKITIEKIATYGLMSQGYGVMPKSIILDKRLNIDSKSLYAYFSVFYRNEEPVFPKQKNILYHLQISRNRYYRAYSQLIKYNYISVIQRHINGRLSVNEYYLNPNPDEKSSQVQLYKNTKKIIFTNENKHLHENKIQCTQNRTIAKNVENTAIVQCTQNCTIVENIDLVGSNDFVQKQHTQKQHTQNCTTNSTNINTTNYNDEQPINQSSQSSLEDWDPSDNRLIEKIKSDNKLIFKLNNIELETFLNKLFFDKHNDKIENRIINYLIKIIINNKERLLEEINILLINDNIFDFIDDFLSYFKESSKKTTINNFKGYLRTVFLEYITNYNDIQLFNSELELVANIEKENNIKDDEPSIIIKKDTTVIKNNTFKESKDINLNEDVKNEILLYKNIPESYLEDNKKLNIAIDYITSDFTFKNIKLIKEGLFYFILSGNDALNIFNKLLIAENNNIYLDITFISNFLESFEVKIKNIKIQNYNAYFKKSLINYILENQIVLDNIQKDKQIESNKNNSIDTITNISEVVVPKDSIRKEIFKENGFPYCYYVNYSNTRNALEVIFENQLDFNDENKTAIANLCVDCLAEMITTKKITKYRGAMVSYSDVIDKFNKLIYTKGNVLILKEHFLIELVRDFSEVIEDNKIKDINAYMKSCIWTSLTNSSVKMILTVNEILNKY